MALTIKETLESKKEGYFIGHRLVLPFKCNILKVIVESHIFTEMVGGEDLKISQDAQNTSLYIRSIGKLSNFFGTYKVVKLVVCDWDCDITDIKEHYKLVCEMGDHKNVKISEPDDDMLFIE